MNSILKQIADYKKIEVEKSKREKKEQDFDLFSIPCRDFIGNLKRNKPAIIAEIKKASPSQGLIRADFDPGLIARIYTENGANCLSVLTDVNFFKGHPDFIAVAKDNSNCPILRKDFIIDSYQIYESRHLGADCILLIVALLDDHQLRDYCDLAQELNMAVLVESHTQAEIERAIQLPTPLMGINNRDLHSFKTDLNTSISLSQTIPADKMVITESGIHSQKDISFLLQHGIDIFLIGEVFMRAKNIGSKLKEFKSTILK